MREPKLEEDTFIEEQDKIKKRNIFDFIVKLTLPIVFIFTILPYAIVASAILTIRKKKYNELSPLEHLKLSLFVTIFFIFIAFLAMLNK